MVISPLPLLSYQRFYTYADVNDFVEALADSQPDLCRLDSLGRSREGRDIHLLTITDFESGSPDDKPAYLIHANIHAVELAGTHAALYVARQLVADYPTSDLLKRVAFYIIPRLNPDGAEFSVQTSTRMRSRTDWAAREPNTLYQEDVDGNGLILTMRQEHSDGDCVADPSDARLLIPRRSDSPGPFYRVFPEGRIHTWDGGDRIKVGGLHSWFAGDRDKVGGRSFDWNRNWSQHWRPESQQVGAGNYPFSELELRYLAEFIHSHSNIFGLLGFHTGYASILRPPAAVERSEIDAADDVVIQELAQIGAQETGFPTVPVIELHLSGRRSRPLSGHFLDYGYFHLGLFAFEVELGTVVNNAGFSTSEYFELESEKQLEKLNRHLMKWWDEQHPQGPLFEPWMPFEHPQLGSVEIGGFLYSRFDNPSLLELPRTLEGVYRFTIKHAQKHPQIALEDVNVDAVDHSVHRIRIRVANRGEFPTHISKRGMSLPRPSTVRVEFHPAKDVELLSAVGHVDLGHLAGITGSSLLEWFVRAPESARELCEIRVLGGTGGNVTHTLRRD